MQLAQEGKYLNMFRNILSIEEKLERIWSINGGMEALRTNGPACWSSIYFYFGLINVLQLNRKS